jgi:hypothetical protein
MYARILAKIMEKDKSEYLTLTIVLGKIGANLVVEWY